jgi:hypothetical protein
VNTVNSKAAKLDAQAFGAVPFDSKRPRRLSRRGRFSSAEAVGLDQADRVVSFFQVAAVVELAVQIHS